MKVIKVHPYGATIYLYRSGEEEAFEKRTGISVSECYGRCIQQTNLTYSVFVETGNKATLVHELYHVVVFVLEVAGINPASDYGEAGAYLIDNLYSRMENYIE